MIMCCNVFNVWPKTTLLLPVWPRDAKRLDMSGTVSIHLPILDISCNYNYVLCNLCD